MEVPTPQDPAPKLRALLMEKIEEEGASKGVPDDLLGTAGKANIQQLTVTEVSV